MTFPLQLQRGYVHADAERRRRQLRQGRGHFVFLAQLFSFSFALISLRKSTWRLLAIFTLSEKSGSCRRAGKFQMPTLILSKLNVYVADFLFVASSLLACVVTLFNFRLRSSSALSSALVLLCFLRGLPSWVGDDAVLLGGRDRASMLADNYLLFAPGKLIKINNLFPFHRAVWSQVASGKLPGGGENAFFFSRRIPCSVLQNQNSSYCLYGQTLTL